MHYRPEVDGLRAVAIVPVILFHAWPDLVPQGYLGVDVFFVLSGYLITTLLLGDHQAGRYSFLRFYERRARRILPALCLVVACTVPLSLWVMLPWQISDLSESIAAVAVFLSNFYFLSQIDYFAPASEFQPLLHTWSLAVEEQYYLFFPPLLALIWRRGTGVIFISLAALALASLAFAFCGNVLYPERNFFFTLSRIWEILAGALVALLLFQRQLPGFGPGALLGLALILVMMLPRFGEGFPPLAVGAVAGTALVLIFAQPGTVAARLLALPPLRGIGLISYSAYLWHQPLFALTRIHYLGEPPALVLALLIVLTLLLSILSWHFVEQPFRRRSGGWLPGQMQALTAAMLALCVMFALAVVGRMSDGTDRIWRALAPERAAILSVVERARVERDLPGDDGLCRFNTDRFDDTIARRIQDCAAQFGPGVAIVGDSHAVDLFGLAISGSDQPFILGLTKPACRPPSDRDCPHDSLPALLYTAPGSLRLVLFELSGVHLMRMPGGSDDAQTRISRLTPGAEVPELTADEPAIAAVLAYLQALQKQVPVLLVSPRIEPLIDTDWLVRRGCEVGLPLRPGTARMAAKIDQELAARARAAGIPWLDQQQLFDLQLPRDFGGCDGLYWSDGDHLSALGESVIGARADVIAAAEALAGGARP